MIWGELPAPDADSAPPASSEVDLSLPNAARIYDAWLGGKDNIGADREVADRIAQAAPFMVEGAHANRAFLRRAVAALARAGIDQFVDLGSGLPTAPNVHQIAHRVNPQARVIYLDRDPVVVAHARALLIGPQTIAVAGDLREPDVILANPQVRAHLDLDRPIGLLLVAVMHFLPDSDHPAGIIGKLRDALAPGSHLVLSHVADLGHVDADHTDQPDAQPNPTRPTSPQLDPRVAATREAATLYEQFAGPFRLRTPAQILSFFDGFDLLRPGLVPAQSWRSGRSRPTHPVPILAGVGRLP